MNLKTWFKGLGVFVASSLITSLAAANLSPSTFNFSKQGLTKLGALALIVGAKAVLLYLKQSPLSPESKTDWTKVSGTGVFAAVLLQALLLSGCVNSWEQTTYATLATGKALIDCAVAGYNHFDADIRNACAATPGDPAFDPSTFYIPQTRDAQQAIEKARQAQIAGVEAFEAYAIAKVGKDKTISLADKEAAVAGYLAQLPALLNAVRALVGKPAPSASRKNLRNQSDALAAIAALRPSADGWKSPLLELRHSAFRSPDLSRPAVEHPITGSPDSWEVSRGQ
jgi:hypothetical protein